MRRWFLIEEGRVAARTPFPDIVGPQPPTGFARDFARPCQVDLTPTRLARLLRDLRAGMSRGTALKLTAPGWESHCRCWVASSARGRPDAGARARTGARRCSPPTLAPGGVRQARGVRSSAPIPGSTSEFSFAGSQELRTQLENGAPADVFASADFKQFDGAKASAAWSGHRRIFATNEPVIVVPRANPGKVASLADLPKATRLVIGTPAVPMGAYTLQILDKAKAKYGADFRSRVEAEGRQPRAERPPGPQQGLARRGRTRASSTGPTPASAKDAVQIIDIP